MTAFVAKLGLCTASIRLHSNSFDIFIPMSVYEIELRRNHLTLCRQLSLICATLIFNRMNVAMFYEFEKECRLHRLTSSKSMPRSREQSTFKVFLLRLLGVNEH